MDVEKLERVSSFAKVSLATQCSVTQCQAFRAADPLAAAICPPSREDPSRPLLRCLPRTALRPTWWEWRGPSQTQPGSRLAGWGLNSPSTEREALSLPRRVSEIIQTRKRTAGTQCKHKAGLTALKVCDLGDTG